MNLLFFLEMLFSGLFAGYCTWLSYRNAVPWGFAENFLGTLLSTGIFASCLTGAVHALPALLGEKMPKKALVRFGHAAAVGLAIPMMATVIFALAREMLRPALLSSDLLCRSGWWLFLAFALALSNALCSGNLKIFCKSLLGLSPAILLAGILNDVFFIPRQLFLFGSITLGSAGGIGLFLVSELLKEAWLEEYCDCLMKNQYLLDTDEFVAGSAIDCDMTLDDGPLQKFCIVERGGLFSIEVIDESPMLISGSRFRYRMLMEGDILDVGDKKFVFHTKYAKARDAIPQAA